MSKKPVKPTFIPPAGKYTGTQVVALRSPVTGATIYYTIDGSHPTRKSIKYTGQPIPVNSTQTIRAMYADGARNSTEATGKFDIQPPVVSAPVFSLPTGPYVGTQNVTLSSPTPGATIYYTTDGTAPSASSTQYTGPIAVNTSMTVTAIAVETGYQNSQTSSASYVIMPQQAAAPSFNPAAGPYGAPQSVTLSTTSAGAIIYYTTDGTPPTTSSTQYIGNNPIQVSSPNTLIQAIASGGGFATSPVASAQYVIQQPAATPVFSPSPGQYATGQNVTLSSPSGASIYYTTDGSQPTTSSTPYAGPIPVNATTTIQAIAFGGGFASSQVATGVYTIPPLTFNDLASIDGNALQNAANRVNQLFTAFKKRGSLSGDEQGQLNDAL